jgi:hypothetical protein
VKQHCLKIVGLALRVVTKQVEREWDMLGVEMDSTGSG